MKYYFIHEGSEVAATVKAKSYSEFVNLAGLMIDEGYHIKEVTKEEFDREESSF